MSTIQIISASAGTGKTYRLAEELCEHILSGAVRPEAILATTFTNRAADELRSRIRTRLIHAGRVEEARRLDAARIGTVNSVCGRLVSDFTFELGLSPDLQVMDEDAAKAALRRAIPKVVTFEQMEALEVLEERLSKIDWQDVVQDIIGRARTNNLSSADLITCAERSIEGFRELLPDAGDAAKIEKGMKAALKSFITKVDRDGKRNTGGALDQAQMALNRLNAGQLPAWQEWMKLMGISPAVKWKDHAAPVQAAAAEHERHPLFREDCETAIRQVFEIAARTLEVYAVQKAEAGAIDFADQEAHALALLADEKICSRLRGELDLMLVDEFQDTSPIQLAIFLKLSEIADRSIWVGDQKQAIYGFRGTDPALMDAAVAAIEATGMETELLDCSWRSRPALVRVTSDLFVKAFSHSGIPEDRVRITTAEPMRKEPKGLGPVLERWTLESKNQDGDAMAIAAGVKQLLADATVRVRDNARGEVRRVRAGDVAVLCRQNPVCDSVAAALGDVGIPAERPRAGLFAAPEARLAVAGLRYWVDQRDSLAAAELARIIEYPDNGNAWLDALIEKEGTAAFEEMPVLQAIRESRSARPTAGAVSVLDDVLGAVQAREMCLRWGDARRRLDNLDALRTLAVQYAGQCDGEGAGCTPAGLIAHFEELEGSGTDMCAILPGEDAVTVTTWHGAKGCEWPVTILFEIDKTKERSALDIHVVSDRDGFDVSDPLAGRWIRYWPSPYHSRTSATGLHARLAEHSATATVRDKDLRERLRLLYVIWTRARDRLVLVTRKGKLNAGDITLLRDESGEPLLSEPEGGKVTWAGNELDVQARVLEPGVPEEHERAADEWYECPAAVVEHPPAFVSASDVGAEGKVGEAVAVGKRLPLNGKPEMQVVGNAIHGFLAADRPEMEDSARRELADAILARWKVSDALTSESVLQASDNLRKWISANWPAATWHREWPVMMRLEIGTVLRGVSDLVLETDDGFVVIDHKSFPGSREQAVEKASGFAGQINAYADAVAAATGKPVLARFIHMPVTGLVLPVGEDVSLR